MWNILNQPLLLPMSYQGPQLSSTKFWVSTRKGYGLQMMLFRLNLSSLVQEWLWKFWILHESIKSIIHSNVQVGFLTLSLLCKLVKYFLFPVSFHQDDPAVHEAVSTLMGSPPNGAAAVTEASGKTVEPTKGVSILWYVCAKCINHRDFTRNIHVYQ